MHSRILRSALLATLAAGSLGVSACAVEHGDGAASTDQAYVHTKAVGIFGKTFDSLMITAGVPSVAFTMTDGNGTLTPPPLLAQLANLTPVTVQFGGAHMSPDWPAPDGTAYAKSVSVTGVTVSLEATDIVASATISAEIWYEADHWYNPSAYVTVDPSPVTIRLAPDGQGGLALVSVDTDLHYHAHDCGFAGWCTDIVDGKLPDLNALVKQYAGVAFASAQPQVTAAWATLLNANANGGFFQPQATWTWTYVPSSPVIAGTAVWYQASRNEAPPAPTCSMQHDCNTGLDDMACYGVIGTLTRFRQHTDGTWLDYSDSKSYPSQVLTNNYKACVSDDVGQSCKTFTVAQSAFTLVGACPKPPPKGPGNQICKLDKFGHLVCPTGSNPPGGSL